MININGLAAGLIASSIWGGMYVVSKVVLVEIPPFVLLSIRLLMAIIVLGIALAIKGYRKMDPRELIIVLGIGLIGYGISLGLQFVGTNLSTASNGAVITSATPAFVFLFAYLILGEPISKRRVAALVISTVGVGTVLDLKNAEISPSLFWGNVSLLAAGITWALYSVWVRKTAQQHGALQLSFIAFLGGLIISIPGGLMELTNNPIGTITLELWAGIIYLGIVSTAVAAYLWNKAFEMMEAGMVSLTFFAQPLVGAVLGSILLGETITPRFILGGIFIGIGIWIAARENTNIVIPNYSYQE